MSEKNKIGDSFLVITLVILSLFIFLTPVLTTLNRISLFSDDAIYAILARRVLSRGPVGALHLTWGPLFPLLLALVHKITFVPIEDSGRAITAFALSLRLIPAWYLAKSLFGRLTAIITLIFLFPAPFFPSFVVSAQPEPLFSLVILCALLFGVLAIKGNRKIFYFLSGMSFGVLYLLKVEGWFYGLPILFFMTLPLWYQKRNRLKIIKDLIILVSGFLLISGWYMFYVSRQYGSFTISPKAGITFTQPGNPFAPIDDNGRVTTLAQEFFSPDNPNYRSILWHQPFEVFRRQLRPLDEYFAPRVPQYVEILKAKIGTILFLLFVFGLLRIILEKGAVKSTISFLLLVGLFFLTINVIIYLLEFSLDLREPNVWFQNRFIRYGRPVFFIQFFLSIAAFTIIFLGQEIKNLMALISKHWENCLIGSYVILGTVILFVANIQGYYILWFIPLAIIVAAYFVSEVLIFIKNLPFKSMTKSLLTVVFCSIVLLGVKPHYDLLFQRNSDPFNLAYYQMYKKPGLFIKQNYGPGHKIAVFHEGVVFYADGTTAYFLLGRDMNADGELTYLKENKVDFFVLNYDEAWRHDILKPLFDPEHKTKDWQPVYVSYDNTSGLDIPSTIVWRYKGS